MSVRYLEVHCKSALNRVSGMGFRWSLNPYQGCFHACVYCFARVYARLADRDPGEGFSSEVRVKVNVADVLRHELSSRSWKGELVAFGTATDPYQPVEGIHRLTRSCLEALRDYRTPVALITKGTMILRDLDVLADLSRRAKTTVNFSIPTVDEDVWRKTEPGTPPPKKRLQVLRKLVEAGIEAGVGMAPILPGISDSSRQLQETVAAASEAGACFLWASLVYLKPGTREHFYRFLERSYPRLVSRYDSLFMGPYAPGRAKAQIQEEVGRLKRVFGVFDRRARKIEPAPSPVQLSLLAQSGYDV